MRKSVFCNKLLYQYKENTSGNRFDVLWTISYWPLKEANITTISDASNVTISGSYTGETSRVYLLQIDSLSTPNNTFRWSNDGGNIYQKQLIPITLSAIPLEDGLSATFTQISGFTYNSYDGKCFHF